jgi:hypothetical protein
MRKETQPITSQTVTPREAAEAVRRSVMFTDGGFVADHGAHAACIWRSDSYSLHLLNIPHCGRSTAGLSYSSNRPRVVLDASAGNLPITS